MLKTNFLKLKEGIIVLKKQYLLFILDMKQLGIPFFQQKSTTLSSIKRVKKGWGYR